MRVLSILSYEWKHFIRSPFKVVALLLFVLAASYGLHNGASLYHEQTAEIERIKETIEENRQEYLAYYEEGKPGPEDAPWINMAEPFWAVWFNYIYHFKTPSPALVYSMGQAEQYGFYKRVTFWASPYDADMTQEIANPERLQTGTLDFSFTLLFLLPLLLLTLLYNIKSMEAEQGFLSLIEVQAASKNTWLLSRVSFYVGLLAVLLVSLLLYGAVLTGVFSTTSGAFGQTLLYSVVYLLLWSVIYYLILRNGESILGNTLKMVGVWLVVGFILPATVLQWISMEKPANLMTDLIDAKRDKRQELFDLPDSVFRAKLVALFPEIPDSPAAQDSTKIDGAYSDSGCALVNELMKESIAPIEADNETKNNLVRNSYWLSPMTYFQNRFNAIAQTHYDDYQNYRSEIQLMIDKQIRSMVLDTWNDTEIDKQKYLDYHTSLKIDE
ncbi:MAG: hypothetical protein AAFP77_17025 [Bacteroidota bacterium]